MSKSAACLVSSGVSKAHGDTQTLLSGCVQEIEKQHTTSLERIGNMRDLDLRAVLGVAEDFSDAVRNAALRFARCGCRPRLILLAGSACYLLSGSGSDWNSQVR